MSYEEIRVTVELSRDVQRSVGVSPRNDETLGELVKGIAAERWVQEPANLISEEPTHHEVRVDGRVLHTFCFVDALMLPFVLEEGAIEVRSDSPTCGEVSAFVTEGGVEGSPPGAVVSFGAARAPKGSWLTTSSTSRRAKSRRVAEDEGRGSELRRVSDLQIASTNNTGQLELARV